MTTELLPTYTVPDGVLPILAGGRPALTTAQGGKVVVDRPTLALWRAAQDCELSDILHGAEVYGKSAAEVACTLACLVRAGLLRRDPEAQGSAPDYASTAVTAVQSGEAPLVSVIIVSYNSRSWLPGCLATLHAQTYSPVEVIVVDNGSDDGSAEWLAASHSEVRLMRLAAGGSLAAALNAGIGMAKGAYLLLLNPDVELDASAIAQMAAVAASDERCAAVAARLRFLWAPAFLNGIGNFVGAFSWGADIALGHLDLGQFDGWERLPSACFAAALIPAAVVEAVGPLDEGFPMYYEDTEWCYRARLMGYHVLAAPRAIIYHAFSGRVPSGDESGLTATKLRRVVYGRLRWAAKLLDDGNRTRFIRRYRLEDLAGQALARLRGATARAEAYRKAWQDYHSNLPRIEEERRSCQARRRVTDAGLFAPQRQAPPALIWRGLPLLTRDIILQEYAPWLTGPGRSGFTETVDLPASALGAGRRSPIRRTADILRDEGSAALLHRVARWMQQRLMQP